MRELSIDDVRFVALDWDDVMSCVERLCDLIASDYDFDVMVGIMRGGVMVANLMSDVLSFEEVYAIGIRSYSGIYERSEPQIYYSPGVEGLRGKRILLVDDVADEGRTLELAVRNVLLSARAAELRTAVLHVKPWTKYPPNYHVSKTAAWILYPWSLYENVRTLSKKLVSRDDAATVIAELLGLDDEKVRHIVSSTGAGR